MKIYIISDELGPEVALLNEEQAKQLRILMEHSGRYLTIKEVDVVEFKKKDSLTTLETKFALPSKLTGVAIASGSLE